MEAHLDLGALSSLVNQALNLPKKDTLRYAINKIYILTSFDPCIGMLDVFIRF